MDESDARGEDDLGRGIRSTGVLRLRLKVVALKFIKARWEEVLLYEVAGA